MYKNFNHILDNAYKELDSYTTIRSNIVIPQIKLEINQLRLHWLNFTDILKLLNRQTEHFIMFLKYEIPNKEISWYSNNENDGLLIHGKNQKSREINDLLKKYISTYVICSSCKFNNTNLLKLTKYKYEFLCTKCNMTKIFMFNK